MRGAISLNQLEYKIGKDLKTSPMSKGDAFTYTANIKYPLLRSNTEHCSFQEIITTKICIMKPQV